MKALPCDHCEQETPAVYLLQDITTGNSVTFCAEHYGMHCMAAAESYATQVLGQDPEGGDEASEVYADPGPFPQINETPESTSNERGNGSVSDGAKNEGQESAAESPG